VIEVAANATAIKEASSLLISVSYGVKTQV
jgi:hypothetical protein